MTRPQSRSLRISAGAVYAALSVAAVATVADVPAPFARIGGAAEPDEGVPEDASSEAERVAPEPEPSEGERLFAEAVETFRAGRDSPERFPDAIRKARELYGRIRELPEGDAEEGLRARAAELYGRMAVGLMRYGTEEERRTLLPEAVDSIAGAERYASADYALMATLLDRAVQIDLKLAEETMSKFRAAIESKGDEKKEEALARLEAVMRRATLVGKKLELAGIRFDGERFDIRDLKGKVVVVDFWATWCPPCLAEHPNLQANYRKYKEKGFEIVGVSLDDDREALEEFLNESDLEWIVLHDSAGPNPATEFYAIQRIPAMFLLDEQGVVISTSARGDELTRLLEERFGKVDLPARKEGAIDGSGEKLEPTAEEDDEDEA